MQFTIDHLATLACSTHLYVFAPLIYLLHLICSRFVFPQFFACIFHVCAGALDEPLMTSAVKSILAKKKVTVPNYDFVTHRRL